MTKPKNSTTQGLIEELRQQHGELLQDLQRTRADFENYRKSVEREKTAARSAGANGMVLKLLPIIDTIERATGNVPAELADNSWARGIIAIAKQLQKQLVELHVVKIDAQPGTVFDPEFHQAVQFDDSSDGEHEVVAEELQAGYMLDGMVIRHAMVKVTRS